MLPTLINIDIIIFLIIKSKWSNIINMNDVNYILGTNSYDRNYK